MLIFFKEFTVQFDSFITFFSVYKFDSLNIFFKFTQRSGDISFIYCMWN